MSGHSKSAAERTVTMPGVDLREQRDEAQLKIVGPLLRKWTVVGGGRFSNPGGTHLVRVDTLGVSLCGLTLDRDRGDHKKVCAACHLAASKMGGIVQ